MVQDVVVPASDTPHLRGGRDGGASHAVLVLHGGREHGHMPTSSRQLSYLRMYDMYWGVRRASSGADAVAAYLLRFRVRGWNAAQPVPDPVRDARYALDEIARRQPGAPIAVLGHSMGGRSAFAVADHPAVVGICALAPWLPQDEPLPGGLDRVSFVIAHGTGDRMTSAPLSLEYARRLRAAGGRVARFELPGARHAMLDRPGLWRRFAVATILGLVGAGPLPPAVPAALDRGPDSPDNDLSTDLSTVTL
jgi:predicted alpha/beta-hydrolase family hydrolase